MELHLGDVLNKILKGDITVTWLILTNQSVILLLIFLKLIKIEIFEMKYIKLKMATHRWHDFPAPWFDALYLLPRSNTYGTEGGCLRGRTNTHLVHESGEKCKCAQCTKFTS